MVNLDDDLSIVQNNLRNAKSRLKRAMLGHATIITTESDPRPWETMGKEEWDAYCKRQSRVSTAQSTVDNLTALLAKEREGYCSVRDVYLDRDSGDLVLDGDWFLNLDGGEQYCRDCTIKALLDGNEDPSAVHACYAHLQDSGYAVHCEACNALLWEGAETYCVLEISAWEDLPDESDLDYEYLKSIAIDGMDMFSDSEADNAIASAKRFACNKPGCDISRQIVVWLDPEGCSENSLVYDSMPDNPPARYDALLQKYLVVPDLLAEGTDYTTIQHVADSHVLLYPDAEVEVWEYKRGYPDGSLVYSTAENVGVQCQ